MRQPVDATKHEMLIQILLSGSGKLIAVVFGVWICISKGHFENRFTDILSPDF